MKIDKYKYIFLSITYVLQFNYIQPTGAS